MRKLTIEIDAVEEPRAPSGFALSVNYNIDKSQNDLSVPSAMENGLAVRISRVVSSYIDALARGEVE